MTSVSNNPAFIESVLAPAKSGIIQSITGSSNNSSSPDSNIPQDTKNKIVTENQSKNSSAAINNNLRFQQNIPISDILSSGQPYNEVNKPFVSKETIANTYNPKYQDQNSNYESSQIINAGSSFYLIDTKSNSSSTKDQVKKPKTPMDERINKTYRTGTQIDTGTLVNVIYY